MGNNNNRQPRQAATPRNQNADQLRAVIEASMTEAPLPLGWDEATTSKGVVYYIDHINQTTTFQDPRLGPTTPNERTRKKTKSPKAVKLPKYKRDLYAKVQVLLYRLHQFQNDAGQVEIRVSRANMFEDSFNFITCLDSLTLTRRLFIKFEGEDGLDYGGMSREWFMSLSEEFLNPERHLFRRSAAKDIQYVINRNSDTNPQHLEHFYFVGMVLGMAIYHGKMFQSYFSYPFFKQLLGKEPDLSDLQYEDMDVYKFLKKIQQSDETTTTTNTSTTSTSSNETGNSSTPRKIDIESWDLTFTFTDQDNNGEIKIIPLIENGENTPVTNANKMLYVQKYINYYFQSTSKQMEQIKKGFYQFVPLNFLEEFDVEEIYQLVGGTQSEIDVLDLKVNTEYGEGASETHPTIKTFWEVLIGFTQEELRWFLQFTTGTTKVPVGGFSHLYGSNGAQKFNINIKKLTGLPTAHSCFNRLELPNYTDKEKLKKELLFAVKETQGFGLE